MTKASILQHKYSKRYNQTSEQDTIKPLNKRQALSSQQVGEKDEMVGWAIRQWKLNMSQP